MQRLRNLIIAIVSIAAVGFAINAFAHGGMGWGGGRGHHGPGWHHQGGYGPGYSDKGWNRQGGYGPGYNDRLSKEEYNELEQKREAFYKETQELRDSLYEKERQLQDELSKTEPDAAKASRLQKDISELQAQFDQRRIDHMVEMRKSNPNVSRGYMRGPMMGSGYRGGGYCWE